MRVQLKYAGEILLKKSNWMWYLYTTISFRFYLHNVVPHTTIKAPFVGAFLG